MNESINEFLCVSVINERNICEYYPHSFFSWWIHKHLHYDIAWLHFFFFCCFSLLINRIDNEQQSKKNSLDKLIKYRWRKKTCLDKKNVGIFFLILWKEFILEYMQFKPNENLLFFILTKQNKTKNSQWWWWWWIAQFFSTLSLNLFWRIFSLNTHTHARTHTYRKDSINHFAIITISEN